MIFLKYMTCITVHTFANEPPVRLRVDISAEFCWHLSQALPLTLSSHKFPHLTLIRMCHMVVALKKPS